VIGTESQNAPSGSPARYVAFERHGDVAVIRLNRPDRLNAASPDLVLHFKAAIERAVSERAVVVIITGRGRAFCAGHDLKAEALAPDSVEAVEHLHRLQDITRLLRSAAIVSIAAVHGYALGAGLEFALSCDFIVADEETTFGFPEVSVGLSVTGGISYLLPQAIGLPMAKELILLGERFGAQRALELGLINRVTAPGHLLPVAHDIADRLLQKPQHALALAKESFESVLREHVETAMAREIENALITGDSTDAGAARSVFATKGEA
jgi:2-(1,2-epoxy-1,2-dihydrophenyl)acetyl-CoA isomerase